MNLFKDTKCRRFNPCLKIPINEQEILQLVLRQNLNEKLRQLLDLLFNNCNVACDTITLRPYKLSKFLIYFHRLDD